jgi:DNA mismatch repair ATPase MutS
MSNIIIQDLLTNLRPTIGSLYKLSEAISSLDMIVSLAEVSSLKGFVK